MVGEIVKVPSELEVDVTPPAANSMPQATLLYLGTNKTIAATSITIPNIAIFNADFLSAQVDYQQHRRIISHSL